MFSAFTTLPSANLNSNPVAAGGLVLMRSLLEFAHNAGAFVLRGFHPSLKVVQDFALGVVHIHVHHARLAVVLLVRGLDQLVIHRRRHPFQNLLPHRQALKGVEHLRQVDHFLHLLVGGLFRLHRSWFWQHAAQHVFQSWPCHFNTSIREIGCSSLCWCCVSVTKAPVTLTCVPTGGSTSDCLQFLHACLASACVTV